MKTVVEIIKDFPAGTIVTDGVREWCVCHGVRGPFLGPKDNDTHAYYSRECEYISILNLHAKPAPKPKRIVKLYPALSLNSNSNGFWVTDHVYETIEKAREFQPNAIRLLTEYPAVEIEVEG